VFAPFWLLEHRSVSTGAKLWYIRLLGLHIPPAYVCMFCYESTARGVKILKPTFAFVILHQQGIQVHFRLRRYFLIASSACD
jgi:hypothetical protein